MAKSNSRRGAEIHEAIRQILYQEWDPIGVSGSAPGDEYDAYVGPIYRILVGSRSERKLIDYLLLTERNIIGGSRETAEPLNRTAHKLMTLNVSL